jgi:hypothetical protein
VFIETIDAGTVVQDNVGVEDKDFFNIRHVTPWVVTNDLRGEKSLLHVTFQFPEIGAVILSGELFI